VLPSPKRQPGGRAGARPAPSALFGRASTKRYASVLLYLRFQETNGELLQKIQSG
jgi:hypothetical protein